MSNSGTGNTKPPTTQPSEKKLKISLAYSGLIYLPIYVAKELGLFKDLDVELVLSNGDDNAVSQVMHSKNQIPDATGKTHYSDIAICDPFSIAPKISDDKKSDPYKDPEEAVIIGCMIDKPPVWIYRSYELKDVSGVKETFESVKDTLPNNDGVIKSLDQIDFKKVKNIHCYPSPNTGFLFGIDLISRGLQKDRKPINITTLDFNPLNCVEGGNNDLILTANIVKIAYDYYLYEKGSPNYARKVIYTYSTGEHDDKLRSFFFTGILTNKKTAQNKGTEIVEFLSGVKGAIKKIKAQDFTEEERKKIHAFLIEQIKTYNHLDSETKADPNALEEIARLILEFSSICNFYSNDLLITPKLYNSTLVKRKEIIKNQEDISYYKYVMLDFVYKANEKQLSWWHKIRYFFQTLFFKIYQTEPGQHLTFTKKYYPEVFSYSVVILLIGVAIILLNFFSAKAYLDYIFGFIGLAVCFWCFISTKLFYRTYKRQKKLREFPKLFLTVVYTVYISAIGGKLLANYFAHKPSPEKENIIIIKGTDTIQFNKTDTSKTIILK